MDPFSLAATLMGLLSPAPASHIGYVALLRENDHDPAIAATAGGESIAFLETGDTAPATGRLATLSALAALTRTPSGSLVALTLNGAVFREVLSPRGPTWADAGLVGSKCPLAAICAVGLGDRLLAISACGDVFTARSAGGAWSFASQLAEPGDRFVAMSDDGSGGAYALTLSGRVWHTGGGAVSVWSRSGQLPTKFAPYAAISATPLRVLTESGELFEQVAAKRTWWRCGRVPAGCGERFSALVVSAAGTLLAMTRDGEVWRGVVGGSECATWCWCTQLPAIVAAPNHPLDRGTPRVALAPNPTRGASTIALWNPNSGPVDVALFDVSGRLARRLHWPHRPAGLTTYEWNGAGDDGRPLVAGTYFLRVWVAGGQLVEKLQVTP